MASLKLFNFHSNVVNTVYYTTRTMGIKLSISEIDRIISSHPDNPNLLCVSDALNYWKIENACIMLDDINELSGIALPCIVKIDGDTDEYVTVTEVNNGYVKYVSDRKGKLKLTKEEFDKIWSNYVIVLEANELSGEQTYKFSVRKEIAEILKYSLLLIVILTIVGTAWLDQLENDNLVGVYYLGAVLGFLASTFLLIIHLDNQNPFVNRICQLNNSFSCQSVLHSPAASLTKWLSWSEIGFVYFLGILITMFAKVDDKNIMSTFFVLAVLAIPYVFFSLYYQAIVLKNWCILCLVIQLVFSIQAVISILILSNEKFKFHVEDALYVFIFYFILFVAYFSVKPFLTSKSTQKDLLKQLQAFKNNNTTFKSLLLEKQAMPFISKDMTMVSIGARKASNIITVITNPFCPACERAHEQLSELIAHKDDIRIDFLYFCCDGTNGKNRLVAQQFISYYLEHPTHIMEAMSHWYKIKDLSKWKNRYQTTLNTDYLNSIVNEQCEWIKNSGYLYTPSVFINGLPLPDEYEIKDLLWLIDDVSYEKILAALTPKE